MGAKFSKAVYLFRLINWFTRLPIPVRSPHQLRKLSNVKFSSRIISYGARKFQILMRFERRNEVMLLIVRIFRLHHAKPGAQSQKLGVHM